MQIQEDNVRQQKIYKDSYFLAGNKESLIRLIRLIRLILLTQVPPID